MGGGEPGEVVAGTGEDEPGGLVDAEDGGEAEEGVERQGDGGVGLRLGAPGVEGGAAGLAQDGEAVALGEVPVVGDAGEGAERRTAQAGAVGFADRAEVEVPVLPGFDGYLVDPEGARQEKRERRSIGKLDAGFAEVQKVLELGAPFWVEVELFASSRRLAGPDDVRALRPAKGMPGMVPAEWQAAQLLRLLERCPRPTRPPSW